MRIIPLFNAKVGTEVFRSGVEADYQEKTINFLIKCKKNDGEPAYPMTIIEAEKKAKKTKIKEIIDDASQTEKLSILD